MVTQVIDTEEGRVLHVWRVVGANLGRYLPFLDRLARSVEAKRIRFGTRRWGWARLARKYGFRPEQVTYVREVS